MRQEAELAVRRLLEALSRRIRVEEAYVFGSSVRGDWLRSSDVDLVVVSRGFKEMSFMERLELVEEVQWKEKVRPHVEVIPLTPEELKEKVGSSAVLIDASKYWRRIA